LAQGVRYAVTDDAADNVGIAAGGKGHDQPDRPLGIFRKRCPRQQRERGNCAKPGNDLAA